MIQYIEDLGFLKKETLPVLIWFTVPGCPPCKAIEPRVIELVEKRGGDFKVFRFDVSKNPSIPQELNIFSTPTFIYFRGGTEIGRLDGFPELTDFEYLLDKSEKGGETD